MLETAELVALFISGGVLEMEISLSGGSNILRQQQLQIASWE